MSIDIKQQLIARVHKSVNFAIQLDETTDIANNAQLMVYVRYQGAQDLEEDILFCQSLDTTTRVCISSLKQIISFKTKKIN